MTFATAARSSATDSAGGGAEGRNRSESRTQPMSRLTWSTTPSLEPSTNSVEPPPMSQMMVPSPAGRREVDAAKRRAGLLDTAQEPRLEPVPALDLGEQLLAVGCVAHRAGGDREHPLGAEL